MSTLFGVLDVMYPPKRDGSVSLSVGFALLSFVTFLLMLAVQFVGIGIVLSFFTKTAFPIGILVGAAIIAIMSTLLYSSFGGFKRDIYTDIAQMIFITVGVLILFLSMEGSELRTKFLELPHEMFQITTSNVVFFMGTLLFVAPTFLVRVDLWQRIITAKTDRQAKAAFIISGVLSLLFFVGFGVLGMYARAVGYADGRFASLELINALPAGFGSGLAVAAFFAAVMSSADTFLGVAGLALAKGVLYRGGELERPISTKVSIKRLRYATLVVGLVSLVLACVMRDIIDLFATAFGILLVFLPSFIAGVVREKPGEAECWWSIGSGLLALTTSLMFIPTEAFLPGVIASTIGYFLAARLYRQTNVAPTT